jgi:hypothetical protein
MNWLKIENREFNGKKWEGRGWESKNILTVYTCITFLFFALALGEKGVFYSDKKISMLQFCTWKLLNFENESIENRKSWI